MTINPAVFWILSAVMAALFAFGTITHLIDHASRGWKRLAEAFPTQPIALGATTGTARLRIYTIERWQAQQSSRIGCLWMLIYIILWPIFIWRHLPEYGTEFTYTIDDDHLHLKLGSGPASLIGSGCSIPWFSIEPGDRHSRHMGEHAVLKVEQSIIIAPIRLVERELKIRATMLTQSSEPEP